MIGNRTGVDVNYSERETMEKLASIFNKAKMHRELIWCKDKKKSPSFRELAERWGENKRCGSLRFN